MLFPVFEPDQPKDLPGIRTKGSNVGPYMYGEGTHSWAFLKKI